MKRLYRWDAINPRTKVYGVVASPVAHSMSPAVHNAAFDETGHDGVYLPLLVNPGYESFKAFMESFVEFPGLDLSGFRSRCRTRRTRCGTSRRRAPKWSLSPSESAR
jgi:3-dehydroquinate dehydratase/shikimate dehydrogenase